MVWSYSDAHTRCLVGKGLRYGEVDSGENYRNSKGGKMLPGTEGWHGPVWSDPHVLAPVFSAVMAVVGYSGLVWYLPPLLGAIGTMLFAAAVLYTGCLWGAIAICAIQQHYQDRKRPRDEWLAQNEIEKREREAAMEKLRVQRDPEGTREKI